MKKVNSTIYVEVGKPNKKRVKALTFYNSKIKRELGLHQHIDHPEISSVSDVNTGYKLFNINKPCSQVLDSDIIQEMKKFIKHYTVELISDRFKEIENGSDKSEP